MGLGDDDALAEREPVRLDDGRHRRGFDIRERRVHVGKDLVGGGRDAVFFHQILGKDLAALDDRGLFLRPEAGDTGGFERVDRAQNERIVRRDDGETDFFLDGEFHHAVDVFRADVNAHGVSRDAAVTGQTIDYVNFSALLECFDDRVFAAPAADNHDIHYVNLQPLVQRSTSFAVQNSLAEFAPRTARIKFNHCSPRRTPWRLLLPLRGNLPSVRHRKYFSRSVRRMAGLAATEARSGAQLLNKSPWAFLRKGVSTDVVRRIYGGTKSPL